MSEVTQRDINWWDELPAPLVTSVLPSDPVVVARDRLSLAFTAQCTAGGDQAIANLLGEWCLDLSRSHPTLALVIAVLHGLDRMDRHTCEPQTWQHLAAAEVALAAYVAKAQEQNLGL